MEDLPGDLEKEITDRSLPKPSKRRPNWTLLFVGDDGRTRSIRPFKGLFYLFIGILMISLGANVILYVLHKDGLKETQRRTAEINQLRQQVDTLRYDKDVLMARMVMTQTRAAKPPTPPKTPAAAPPDPVVPPGRALTEEAVSVKTVAEPARSAPQKATASPRPETSQARVSLAELDISRSEATENTVLVRFNLRKIGTESENISGHAFVVLKLAEDDPRPRNITIPWASMDSGKPAPTTRGQYFSISRFKPMKFERRRIRGLEQFSRLTVYVFDTGGGLLLEKEFPVEIPPPEPVEVLASENVEAPARETSGVPEPESVESPAPETSGVPESENAEVPAPENNQRR